MERTERSPRSSARVKGKGSVFQVLDNPSLREEILKYAIFEGSTVDHRTACSLRFVGKSWNESVIKILRKQHEPLCRLGGKNGGHLNTTMRAFSSSAHFNGLVPSLRLPMSGDLNRQENLERFSNCLIIFGPDLVGIGMKMSENWRPFEGQLPQGWSLPLVHKLQVTVEVEQRQIVANQPEAAEVETFSSSLIKSVLSGANDLREMDVDIRRRPRAPPPPSPLPPIFESVILPVSITKIACGGRLLNSDLLEMVARNSLPNLISLSLSIGRNVFPDDLLFRVLDNVSSSLKSFVVSEQFNNELSLL